jgi:hypothetical protein
MSRAMRRPGFGALGDAAGNFVAGLEWILVAAITFAPWILLGLLGYWGWRWFRRHLTPLPAE